MIEPDPHELVKFIYRHDMVSAWLNDVLSGKCTAQEAINKADPTYRDEVYEALELSDYL